MGVEYYPIEVNTLYYSVLFTIIPIIIPISTSKYVLIALMIY